MRCAPSEQCYRRGQQNTRRAYAERAQPATRLLCLDRRYEAQQRHAGNGSQRCTSVYRIVQALTDTSVGRAATDGQNHAEKDDRKAVGAVRVIGYLRGVEDGEAL